MQAAVEKFVTEQRNLSSARRLVTLIPGDGTGPETTQAVQTVFKCVSAEKNWLIHCFAHTHACVAPQGPARAH